MILAILNNFDKFSLALGESEVVKCLMGLLNDCLSKNRQLVNGLIDQIVDSGLEGFNRDDFFLKGFSNALDGTLDTASVFFEALTGFLMAEENIVRTVRVETDVLGLVVLRADNGLSRSVFDWI